MAGRLLTRGVGVRGARRRASIVVCALALIAAALAAAPAAGARQAAVEPSPWSWLDRGPKLLAVSCAAPEQCVAGGEDGAILRSTPAGPEPLTWERVPLPSDQAIVSIACRATTCVAISGGDGTTAGVSKVFRSTDGGEDWSQPDTLPPATVTGGAKTRVGTAVACGASGNCVIAGRGGGIWRSTDDGATFSPLAASSLGLSYRALACPRDELCILVGSGTPVVLDGTDATTTPSPTTGSLRTIACESHSTCTAADTLGRVISIDAPWKGWGTPVRLPHDLDAVSLACPAANTCVGLTGKGPAVRTTNRSGGVWAQRPTGTVNLLALDCAGSDCAAVGKAANWYGSEDTGFGWEQVNAVPKLAALDCPAGAGERTCVAGGMMDIARSTTSGNLWTTPLSGTLSIAAVSCAGFPTCLALSSSHTFASTDAGTTWANRVPAGSLADGPEAGTCLDADYCVAVGHGFVFTTLDGAETGWAQGSLPLPPGEGVKAIACPTTTTCLVATTAAIYRGELATGGPVSWRWVASDADPSDPLNGIACSSPTSCTAVGFAGQVLTTTDPAFLHWDAQQIGTGPDSNRPPLKAVACPADGICVAAGERGFVATTSDNWANWSLDQIGGTPKPSINAASCQSPTRCVLVGDTAFAGHLSPPTPRTSR